MQANLETIRVVINRTLITERLNPGEVLLDFLRDRRRLTGTRGACREGDCGSCLVLLGELTGQRLRYRPVNSCLLPMGALDCCHVVTIEGLNGSDLNPIQQALVDAGAIQCGYCTPGLVLALTGYFVNAAQVEPAAACDAVAGNLCRCTGYAGIKRAIDRLCRRLKPAPPDQKLSLRHGISQGVVPAYFEQIETQLAALPPGTSVLAKQRQSVPVAGGTDLFVQQPEQMLRQPLQFVKQGAAMAGIEMDGQACVIGAATTIEAVRTSPLLMSLLPSLGTDLQLVCSAPIRQQATVGGNLINASPIADLGLLFLALDSSLLITDGARQRQLPLRVFFQAYKQIDLRPNERLLAVRFVLPAANCRFSFEKISKRKHLDIAAVNSALSIRHRGRVIEQAHLCAGGVAAIPLYLASASAALQGQTIDVQTIRSVLPVIQDEIAPITDIRGTAEYKRLLLRQLVIAHFIKLFPQWIDEASLP